MWYMCSKSSMIDNQVCPGLIWRAVAAILKLFGITVCLAQKVNQCPEETPRTAHSLVIFLYTRAIHYEDVALCGVNNHKCVWMKIYFGLHVWVQSSIGCLSVFLVDHVWHESESASTLVNLGISLQQLGLTRLRCRCETIGQSIFDERWRTAERRKKKLTAIFCLSMYAALIWSSLRELMWTG